MLNIIVATLGDLSQGLTTSAEHIIGKVQHVTPFSVHWGDSHEQARSALGRLITDRDKGQGVLVLTDLYGGSATNIAMDYLEPGKVDVVTGVNLSMVVSAFTLPRNVNLSDAAAKLRADGRRAIYTASENL